MTEASNPREQDRLAVELEFHAAHKQEFLKRQIWGCGIWCQRRLSREAGARAAANLLRILECRVERMPVFVFLFRVLEITQKIYSFSSVLGNRPELAARPPWRAGAQPHRLRCCRKALRALVLRDTL